MFPSEGIEIIFGLFLIFFLVDYPLYKLRKYEKSPRITFSISCAFHIISVFIFLFFVKQEESRGLFWTFVVITVAINIILDLRKKMKPGGGYISRLSFFDWIWIIILVIMFSISFGKNYMGRLVPDLEVVSL